MRLQLVKERRYPSGNVRLSALHYDLDSGIFYRSIVYRDGRWERSALPLSESRGLQEHYGLR